MAHTNRWKIPLERSVEPARHHLINVITSPVHGQFKHIGRVQPTETSKDLKGLNEQAPKPPLLKGARDQLVSSDTPYDESMGPAW